MGQYLPVVTMAVLATGLGWVAGIGGALFFVSDSLIALRAFADVTLPAHGFWVMLTYIVGQTLLVLAVVSVQGGEVADTKLWVHVPNTNEFRESTLTIR